MIFFGLSQSAMVDQAKGRPSFSLPGPEAKIKVEEKKIWK